MSYSRTALLVAVATWLSTSAALAHPLAPASLALREGAGGALELSLRATPEAYPMLSAVLPDGCVWRGPMRAAHDEDASVGRRALRCDAVPRASELRLRGLEQAGVDAVVRVERVDATVDQALLTPSALLDGPPAGGPQRSVFVDYLRLGFAHLWAGPDHLLFVLCLLLLARGVRSAAWGLSAFTLGHALTLSLSALDLLRLPQAPAEVLIAASLVWMAGSVLLEGREGRRLLWAGLLFGLVHGLGFAGVLREAGLPTGAVAPALLAFNLGIELGQLSLALSAWVVFAALRPRLPPKRLELATAYALASVTGVAGAFWVFERLI